MTTNYREILRLESLGLNKTDIASAAQCARNTVSTTLARAKVCGLRWPLPEGMSDEELEERLFPSAPGKVVYKMPDYAHVHREMQRQGVTLTLGLIVDAEWNARKSNHLQRLIRQATFSDPAACLENVEYLPDRKLKKEELLRLGTCNYIHEHHNVILLGATGSGKTYLACALGMAAARQFLAVKYVRLPDLLVEFSIARGNGTIRKLMAQYKKYSLLVIDEWLLYPLKESECRDLLEIMESRYRRASTILCSQFDIPGWRDKLSDPILADAICDRIVHDAYTILIDGQESMRKRKGLNE